MLNQFIDVGDTTVAAPVHSVFLKVSLMRGGYGMDDHERQIAWPTKLGNELRHLWLRVSAPMRIDDDHVGVVRGFGLAEGCKSLGCRVVCPVSNWLSINHRQLTNLHLGHRFCLNAAKPMGN